MILEIEKMFSSSKENTLIHLDTGGWHNYPIDNFNSPLIRLDDINDFQFIKPTLLIDTVNKFENYTYIRIFLKKSI